MWYYFEIQQWKIEVMIWLVTAIYLLTRHIFILLRNVTVKFLGNALATKWIMAESEWGDYWWKYNARLWFLNYRNELLSLAVVLAYNSMENCGIWINSTCVARNFTRQNRKYNFSCTTCAINPDDQSFPCYCISTFCFDWFKSKMYLVRILSG